MNRRIRPFALLLALSLVVGVGLALPTATATAGPSATAVLQQIPDSTDSVAVIDVKAVNASSIGAGLVSMLSTKLGKSPVLGNTPITAIDNVIAASYGSSSVLILDGSFPADLLAKTKYSSMATDRGITVYTLATNEAAAFGSTIVVTDIGEMTRFIDLRSGKGKAKSAAKSKKAATLRSVVGRTNIGSAAWMVAQGAIMGKLAGAGITANSISTTVSLGKTMNMAVNVDLNTAAAATSAVASAQTAISQMGSQASAMGLSGAVKSLTISANGSILEARMTLTQAELTTLSTLFQSLIP